ncbi:uncharacterized protein H6S33_007017 [Morchella sextelata]|uniref:uncharacterized protein n=1 Tax=Morchella sextelata TaxID=1174677 RepID=UPI001D0513B2|nr:uncharacterized protein H6S33_007017 [Morchella sextelata]KAH0603986.1 hypothetical protein H6S33_007017 [Morchella sextelata]
MTINKNRKAAHGKRISIFEEASSQGVSMRVSECIEGLGLVVRILSSYPTTDRGRIACITLERTSPVA